MSRTGVRSLGREGRRLCRRPSALRGASHVNLAEIIEPHPDDAVALISRGAPTTYGELRSRSRRFEAAWSGSGSGPAIGSACSAATTGTSSSPTSPVLGIGGRRGPAQPAQPGARARRASSPTGRHGRGDRRAGRARELGRRRPRRRCRRCDSSSAPRGHPFADAAIVRRPAHRRPRAGGLARGRRPRRADVHERHRRLAAKAAMLTPRQPARQPRAGAGRSPAAGSGPTTSCSACCRCSTSSA